MKTLTESLIKILFTAFLMLMQLSSFAQVDEKVIVERLNSKDKKKLEKAEKLLSKGNGILEEAKQYDARIAEMKEADGKIKMRKINKLVKRSNTVKIKASGYLIDGYKKKSKGLESVLKDARKINLQYASRIKEVELNSDKEVKKARKLFRKADNMSSDYKRVEFLELGYKHYEKAINHMFEGLAVVYDVVKPDVKIITDTMVVVDNIKAESSDTSKAVKQKQATAIKQENAISNPVTAAAVPVAAATAVAVSAKNEQDVNESAERTERINENVVEETAAATTEEAVVVSESKAGEEDNGVFFTVQFMADKKLVSQEVLRSKYSGSHEIVEIIADGWYRYSVGRFKDLQEAKNVMRDEGIKGFIVAYKDGERITIKEAIELLK